MIFGLRRRLRRWDLRRRLRRWGLGLRTLLGGGGGFFIPYRYSATVPPPGQRPPYAAAEQIFEDSRAAFKGVLDDMDGFAAELMAIGAAPPPAPRWQQDWFPRLDGAAAYVLTRRLAPARLIEIGSGHSTRFFARAVADGGLATRIQAIDPAPRADLAGLATIDLLQAPLQDVPPDLFDSLEAGDFMVVDSSHILMPGTDVDLVINRILPRLPAGVIVHFHDIFLPDDYPSSWAWRGYNEQLALAPLLVSGGWEVLFASHYVAAHMASDVDACVVRRLTLPEGAHESSLWLRKIGQGAHEKVTRTTRNR